MQADELIHLYQNQEPMELNLLQLLLHFHLMNHLELYLNPMDF